MRGVSGKFPLLSIARHRTMANVKLGMKLRKFAFLKHFDSTNFNPAIAGGIRGSPGILARLNPRGFQYLSTIAGGILSAYSNLID